MNYAPVLALLAVLAQPVFADGTLQWNELPPLPDEFGFGVTDEHKRPRLAMGSRGSRGGGGYCLLDGSPRHRVRTEHAHAPPSLHE